MTDWIGDGHDLIADEARELQQRSAWRPMHPLTECPSGPAAAPVLWVATASGCSVEVEARLWEEARRKAARMLGVQELSLVPVRKQ